MWPWSPQSVLEADLALKGAHIKLASVATDVMGASGRAIIRRLIEGAQARRFGPAAVTGKIPELERTLEEKLTDHHRFLLKLLCKELVKQEELIAEFHSKVQEHRRRFAAELERLDAITGVDHRVAEVLLAEVGADIKPFPSDAHLCCGSRFQPRYAGACNGGTNTTDCPGIRDGRRAERRYGAVEPEKRLAARGLETEWEKCLRDLADAKAKTRAERKARAC